MNFKRRDEGGNRDEEGIFLELAEEDARVPRSAVLEWSEDYSDSELDTNALSYGVPSQMKVSRGLLPIPIDIPEIGKPYYFGKILATDEPFEIRFNYRKSWF